MKFHYALCILWIPFLQAQETKESIPTQTKDLPINVNVHVSNHLAADHNSQASQSSKHSNSTRKVTENSTLPKELYAWLEQQSKNYKNNFVNSFEWIKTHKAQSLCLVALGGYSYLAYQIYHANSAINQPTSWANWQHMKSLDELFTTPPQQMQADLLFEIQSRYVHPTDPTDFMYSLAQSRLALQQESYVIQHQIELYKFLEKYWCLQLFFIEKDEIATLQEKHRKLSFIQHVLTSWCANYKIEKINHKNQP